MESFLPDWAPNLHPLVIHFPIALWLVAVFFEFLLLLSSAKWFRSASVSLYVLAALSSLVAYQTGEQAMDEVSVPFRAEMTAASHSDWGHYTFYFFTAFAAIRLFLYFRRWDRGKFITILLLILGLTGAAMMVRTADLGAKLVYKYGVGTKN